MVNLDLDARQRNFLVEQLYSMEQNMAVTTMNRRQYALAEGHCQRCLAYSKRYGLEGEEKITMIFEA
jgi:hypothetical protein